MEEEVTQSQVSPESVISEDSQPTQENAADVNNAGETQQQTPAEEMISRIEYNKTREALRKRESELARYKDEYEKAKGGIDFHSKLSKSSPEKLQKIMAIIEAQEEQAKAEDDSWLNEYDPKVAARLREVGQVKNLVQRELLSRINSVEDKLKQAESFTIDQNSKNLDSNFESFLKQNKIFPEITEEVVSTPKYQMIQSYVLNRLGEKYQDPRMASVEDLQLILNDVKSGLSEIGKNELSQKVRPVVPISGSRAGQIPKSDQKPVTEEDVTNLWSSFKQETGW